MLPSGTPDPVVAMVGDKLSAVVVTWDRDFDALIRRVPIGNKAQFRKLGRITFSCDETRGRMLAERWIDHIELQYRKAMTDADVRMIVQIQESGVKMW